MVKRKRTKRYTKHYTEN